MLFILANIIFCCYNTGEVRPLSDFNINESADIFNEKTSKPNIVVSIIKWLGIGIILLICLLLMYRCITAKNHPIVHKVLMNEEFYEAYEKNPESVKVRKYGMQSAWESVDQGRIVEFNSLYHIPATDQLQFSIKYNHDIVKGKFNGIPFKLRLVDEKGNVYEEYWYEKADRERFRYIRVCFEDIELEKAGLDKDGNKQYHSYTLEIEMVNEKGDYEPLCKYLIFDGKSERAGVFKDVKFDVEKK